MGEWQQMGQKTGRSIYLLLALILCLSQLPARAADPDKTIRVAFMNQGPLTAVAEDGQRSGYEYEYLQEIAQYTGWNYEFVDMKQNNQDILSAMEQLKTGQIDLMTATIYSEGMAEQYDYAAYSHGSVNTVLAVFDESSAITESNLFQNRTLRVAVFEKAPTRLEELQQFCAMSGVEVETVVCSGLEAQREAVRTGQADVLLEVDVNLPPDMRAVARFAPRPFYFVTTKGNNALLSKLNAALVNIDETDPYFAVGLYEKYFSARSTALYLTEEEQTYIRGTGVIRVAVVPGRMPVQDMDGDTGEFRGVSRQVFDYITESTGLQFEFVLVDSAEKLESIMVEGTVELISGMPYSYITADRFDVVMTRPYFQAQTTFALAKGVSMEALEGKRPARSMGSLYYEEIVEEGLHFDTPRECLEALERGEADYAVNNSYTMQYYATQGRYRNVTLVPQSGVNQRLCIGINKPVNVTLLTVLNKAIRSLPADELQAMIYRSASTQSKVTFTSFVADNSLMVLICVLVVAALVVGLLVIYFRAHIRNARREALESERYKQISELTGEHIFEYDYRNDRVILSERSAKTLGVEQVRENYLFRLQQNRTLAAEKERAFFERVSVEKAGTEELNLMLPDGNQRWFRIAAKVIDDQQGKPILAVGRLTDIQRERAELERLAEKARRDSLTGIYNGETTRQLASRRLQERAGGALLVMDVDKFKDINDHNGHFVGDQALIAVAQLLEDTFRRSDVVGRLGGDEFVVFMDRAIDNTVVENKCRQILTGVTELPEPLRGLGITVSIGAVMADGERSYDQLYQMADKALYEVKESGRNNYKLL